MSDLVLVTGAAGYVGSVTVVELLQRGHRVRGLDALLHADASSLLTSWGHPGFEFVRADIRDDEAVERALDGVDSVVHLAAIVGDPACARQPDEARMVNFEATRRLLECARGRGAQKFVFASTCSNYGKIDGAEFATEEFQLRPVSLYAETKVAAELDVMAAATAEFRTVCLRFATVYGTSPRMRFDLTVNEFTRDVVCGRELVVYGEQFWRPYVHVRDAAHAIAVTIHAGPEKMDGGVFNVGSTGENYRKLDLVELLRERFPQAQVSFVHRTDDPRDYRVSFDKIGRLGFVARRRVPDGISEVADLLGNGVIADPFDAAYTN